MSNGIQTKTIIGTGHILDPKRPISGKFVFSFMTRENEKIGDHASIILKTGIRRDRWPIRKDIILLANQLFV
jgi:hypothetical protein